MGWLKRLFGSGGASSRQPDNDNDYESSGTQRSVPSAETRSGTLIDNGDGTLTDTASGLMWQADDDGTRRNWDDAAAYCESLSLAGYSNWRLPTLSEFESIARAARDSGMTVNTTFSRAGDGDYWSATPGPQGNVAYVAEGVTMFRTNDYFVRAVRAM